jgi:UTP:GlnB (protein PII) uridylyltransferase
MPTLVSEFLAGMPLAYRSQFSEADAKEHAAIVWRRSQVAAHVEQWVTSDKQTTWLVVVTDDRPGLLAALSTAITAHSLNILDAKIYCHIIDGERSEAVDFFRVAQVKGAGLVTLTSAELASLARTITGTLQGKIDLSTLRRRSTPTLRSMTRPETSVYFDGERSGASRLIVETEDQTGLLASVTSALFKASVSIVWSNVATIAGQVRDEFHLIAPDGRSLAPQHQETVIASVLNAMSHLEAQKNLGNGGEPADSPEAGEERLSQIQMTEPAPLPRPRRFSKPPDQL